MEIYSRDDVRKSKLNERNRQTFIRMMNKINHTKLAIFSISFMQQVMKGVQNINNPAAETQGQTQTRKLVQEPKKHNRGT